MGWRWWARPGLGRPGPSMFDTTSHGPAHQTFIWCSVARPFSFSEDGPRPGSARHLLKTSQGRARPDPSHFQISRLSPAHDIGGEAHETRGLHGQIYAISVGLPVDFLGMMRSSTSGPKAPLSTRTATALPFRCGLSSISADPDAIRAAP